MRLFNQLQGIIPGIYSPFDGKTLLFFEGGGGGDKPERLGLAAWPNNRLWILTFARPWHYIRAGRDAPYMYGLCWVYDDSVVRCKGGTD